MSFDSLNTKSARIAHIREMLSTDARWAVRALVRIFENQTADEQSMETVVEANGVGFTGADGEILSSFAKQIIAGRTMSAKQMALIFKKMPKYSKQLEGVAQ